MRVSTLVKALGATAGHAGAESRREATITGLSCDSRTVAPGDCFVALRGSRVDGSRFVPDALARGASLAVATTAVKQDDRICIVDDPLHALGVLGGLVRDRFTGPVVGITGSVGKTTVKEMLRTLVAPQRRAVFPEASHNNFEGVPRTLARLTDDTELCVVELGTNAPGEIEGLCAIARPTIGILTAIGAAHLEGLGSIEGVLEEKLGLARALPEGATLFINADDERLAGARYPEHLDVVRVGLEPGPGVIAPSPDREPGTLPVGEAKAVHRLGTRVLERSLWMALVVARALGLDDPALAAAAGDVEPAPLRGELITRGATRFVLDCYNANPLSMGAALDDLRARSGRRVAVLGEMLELGAQSERLHRQLGERVASVGVEAVLFIGPSGDAVAQGFVRGGGRPTAFEHRPDVDAARDDFARLSRGGGTILLKGSRGVALERLLEDADV